MPLAAIVGRPNVGKSTFYNRLTGTRQSIVHDEPGVTRDRIYGECEWNGEIFDVVDTGGYVPRSADRFEKAIREQVEIALDEADLLFFVVDVTTGITDLDQELGNMLRKTEKPVLVVANKADNQERRWDAGVFYQLGLDEVFPVSSINGSGTGELLDRAVDQLEFPEEPEEETEHGRIALVGRPNVGKSSLVNKMLGEERAIVTEISGTTRDAIDSQITYKDHDLTLVDTAGLRKRARVKENVEFYSTLRTERAVRSSEVCVLLIDATQGLENQDIKVLKMAEREKKGLVIAINKWDLVPDKETNTARDYEELIRGALRTMNYVPVVTISALSGQRVPRLLDTVLAVMERRRQKLSTSRLNAALEEALKRHQPPTYRNMPVRINYTTQVQTSPPVLAFYCNHPKGVKDHYRRFLERTVRTHFDFEGVPLTLAFKSKRKERSERS